MYLVCAYTLVLGMNLGDEKLVGDHTYDISLVWCSRLDERVIKGFQRIVAYG